MTAIRKSDSQLDAILSLPIHPISGYEWECGECHYHWGDDGPCDVCGEPQDGDYVDHTGRPTDHTDLISREAVVEILRGAA